MAMAMAVPSRLWLGGVVSARRDLTLIMAVVGMVRRAARHLAFLVCVDGLASYVTAFTRAFRTPVRTGKAGVSVFLVGRRLGHQLMDRSQKASHWPDSPSYNARRWQRASAPSPPQRIPLCFRRWKKRRSFRSKVRRIEPRHLVS